MRLPLRALHVFPAHICLSPSCVSNVLDEPILSTVPVRDTIGIEYAFDLQVTQGFYTLVFSYIALRAKILESLKKPDEQDLK